MYSHMRLDYTGEEEHQYLSRLHLRYHPGDWFNISPSIHVKELSPFRCRFVYSVFWGTNVINISVLHLSVSCDHLKPALTTPPTAPQPRVVPVNAETSDATKNTARLASTSGKFMLGLRLKTVVL